MCVFVTSLLVNLILSISVLEEMAELQGNLFFIKNCLLLLSIVTEMLIDFCVDIIQRI